ncbi:hypothetical protein [Collinsella sp. AM18-10]|uniref:hypothetical protein n=1 Tax=Collinsella sp. AM18-10 TaxID=2292028 RepID=UPI0011C21362|nr:hypothetical protein [Collinsella sp. AM18-10]
MSLIYAVGVLLMDATVGELTGSAASSASIASMLVTLLLIVALIFLEVRAYRAVVASVPFEPDMGDKVLLSLSLWFGGGMPLGVANLVRAAALGGAGDVRQILMQLGVSVALMLLTYPKFRA